MRRSVYGIGFFCAAALLCLGFCASYRLGERNAERRAAARAEESGQASLPVSADAVPVPEGESADEPSYVAKEREGRIVIYRGDGATVYEYTDIPLATLPQGLQQEIREGIRFDGMRELYGFLENYSS